MSTQLLHCPPWCVAVHAVEDEGTVTRHRSNIVDVAAIQPAGATALMLEVHRTEGEPTTWVYVGDGERQYLELSVESAVRVAAALERVGATT